MSGGHFLQQDSNTTITKITIRSGPSRGPNKYPTDIVYFKTAESEGAVYHPTQKPVELGRYLIRTYTNPGDIVLDNACGSGSFCVAAVLEGRSFIGIEKNEDVALFKKRPVDYIDVCNQRIKEAKRTFEAEQQAIS